MYYHFFRRFFLNFFLKAATIESKVFSIKIRKIMKALGGRLELTSFFNYTNAFLKENFLIKLE